MKEIDEIKQKFKELQGILRTLIESYRDRLLAKFSRMPVLNLNAKIGLALVGLALAVGFFAGSVANKEGQTLNAATPSSPWNPFKWFGSVFAGRIYLSGTQPDGSFLFSNFETQEAMNSWTLIAARMMPSTNYAWEGAHSGQVTFLAGKEIAAISIDELGKSRSQPSDWSAYDSFQMYVFHPGDQFEELNFLVTDIWGKRYSETLKIPPVTWVKIVVPMAKISAALNTKKVNQVSISRRQTSIARDFYFDDTRLISLSTRGALSRANMFDYGFSDRKVAWSVFDPQVNSQIVHVPFVVKNETTAFCHLCPAEGGIPLPMGEVQDFKSVRISNSYGEDIPFQSRVLAYWPDRSVRWLGVHLESTLPPGQGAGYFVDYGPNIRGLDFASSLKVTENDQAIIVNTGSLEAVLSKRSFYLFDRVSVDRNANGTFESSEEMTSKAQFTLSFHGKEFRTDLDSKTYKIEVEEKGSQRVVIKASGWYQSEDGKRENQAIVRYYFYQGKNYVKLSHTLIYTAYPANEQFAAYKLARLPENEPIEAFGLRIPYQFSEKRDEQVFLGLSQRNPFGMALGDKLELYQQDYDIATLRRDGGLINPENNPENAYAGWFSLSNEEQGIAVSLRYFRENFPKAFKVDRTKGMVQVDLWPQEAGPLDLSTTEKAVGPDAYGRGSAFGLAKTHDLLIYFHKGKAAEANALNVAGSFMKPLIIRSNPYWMDATGALGRLFPSDPKYATAERILDRLFDWADRQPKNFKWYGMLNFGDTLTWWRNDDGEGGTKYTELGWHPTGRWGWYNCEGVGVHTGALLQFARTGIWKYFEVGESMAKHIMDVDTIHYDTVKERNLRNMINERYSQVGSMHRHNGDHWGDRSDEASHTSVVGILLYYYLSGNERALDVAKEVGEFFLKEPFGYVDRPDLAPNRAMANTLWGDVLLYQATWEERYKAAADKIVKIFLKGQQPDGSFLENYNLLTKTWSGEKHELYMSGYAVGALMSYHELTQDEEVKETLLKLVRYLAPTEYSGPAILHGIAYAYLITRDPFFIFMAETNLNKILMNQQLSSDPLVDGLIYPKQIYHRPMTFLSTVPYVFGALEEHFSQQEQHQGKGGGR